MLSRMRRCVAFQRHMSAGKLGIAQSCPKAAEIRGAESAPRRFIGSAAAQLGLSTGLVSAQGKPSAKPEEVSGLIVPIHAMLAQIHCIQT